MARDQELDYPTYRELEDLSSSPSAWQKLESKLTKFFKSSIIDNSATRAGVKPTQRTYSNLGNSIGMATWNIEKSLSVDKSLSSALSSQDDFVAGLNPNVRQNPKKLNEALRQRQLLLSADVINLQEMDIGHPRSGHINAAKKIAKNLGMNYCFAPHHLEIDPRYFSEDSSEKEKVKNTLYKGVFGTAVLSRYPIKSCEVVPLARCGYDWNNGERAELSPLEKLRRFGVRVLLGEKVEREVKHGCRAVQIVNLHVPGQPNDTVTVVNVHLEIKSTPEERSRQIKEILERIKHISNPVIMAGDFNTSSQDISPTNIPRAMSRALGDHSNQLSAVVSATTSVAGPLNLARRVVNGTKNYLNPMAPHIPVLLPNKQRELFRGIEKFEFSDGACFDFRGDINRSMPGFRAPWNDKAANSNERGIVSGFKHTFETERGGPLSYGRLDWIFVKAAPGDCKSKNGTYKMAPHYGEVFDTFNRKQVDEFSDHDPMYVALPLAEPTELNNEIATREAARSARRWVRDSKGGGRYVEAPSKDSMATKVGDFLNPFHD